MLRGTNPLFSNGLRPPRPRGGHSTPIPRKLWIETQGLLGGSHEVLVGISVSGYHKKSTKKIRIFLQIQFFFPFINRFFLFFIHFLRNLICFRNLSIHKHFLLSKSITFFDEVENQSNYYFEDPFIFIPNIFLTSYPF